MSEKAPRLPIIERLSRFQRNIELLGALALSSAALLIPGPNAALGAMAGRKYITAGGYEVVRRVAN